MGQKIKVANPVVELDGDENLLVHIFDENDFDIFCDFSDLDESDQLTILSFLNTI